MLIETRHTMSGNRAISSYISKEETSKIKGVALICMFIHHFFTFPDKYIETVSYPELYEWAIVFCEPFKICVPVFAFLTGYFYAINNKTTMYYSIRKMTDIWIEYLIVFHCLLVLALAMGIFDISSYFPQLFGFNRTVMSFCWYVVFYFEIMLLLPIFDRIAKIHPLIAVITCFAAAKIINTCYSYLEFMHCSVFDELVGNLWWFSVVAMGWIIARFSIFERIMDPLFIEGIKSKIIQVIIFACILFISFWGRRVQPTIWICIGTIQLHINMDVFYAPCFIYALINIYRVFPWKRICCPVSVIGKHSLKMWFLHSVFFNCCEAYTQPILFFSQNPIIVLAWGLALCLCGAVVLEKPTRLVQELKNKLMERFCANRVSENVGGRNT